MSRHKVKHFLLQETPINNMTSNEETNDIMALNEEAKENTINSALHQDLDIWLKRELLPINVTLKELNTYLRLKFGPKTMKFDYCGLIIIVSIWRFQLTWRRKQVSRLYISTQIRNKSIETKTEIV